MKFSSLFSKVAFATVSITMLQTASFSAEARHFYGAIITPEENDPQIQGFMHHPNHVNYAFPHQQLPSQVDFRDQCPPVYNQEQLGSCTANAGAGAVWYILMQKNQETAFDPSRLFLYYNERALMESSNNQNQINNDTGSPIYDVVLSLYKTGICPNNMWPYDTSKYAEQPPESCYEAAKKTMDVDNIRHSFVPRDLNSIKTVLFQKTPIVFGITVYQSFESLEVDKTGVVPMPEPKKGDQVLGGHALMLVGYNDDTQQFIFRNSWGEMWGDKGYGYIPYDYLMSSEYASGRYFIQHIEGQKQKAGFQDYQFDFSQRGDKKGSFLSYLNPLHWFSK